MMQGANYRNTRQGFADPADKARHDRMVALVTQMLDLNKRLQDARLEQEKTLLQRQVVLTDAAIDKDLYELDGLTQEVIHIIKKDKGIIFFRYDFLYNFFHS
jgi:hypothetical protein